MHIAPSGSPQPTKQAFICKLYSGFPRIFSQQNLTAVYAYRKAQETKFYGKLSPKPQIIFGDVFSQDKENERRRTSVLQAKFDAIFGKTGPNLKSFFGDVFSQDKASKPPLYMHTARRKKRSFTGETQPETSNHFSVMFFSQDKENKRRRTSVLRAKFDAVFGKLSPNLKSFFGDVFSQDKASKPPLYMHTARRKKRSIAKKQPEKSDFHNVGFLFLCHIVNFFNVFVGYLLNFVLTVVELVFGYGFIFVELF